ncbi:hypothetical protein BGM09_03685 [Streptomyces sp. CBMA29]|nr:hypothetical protein [Streptomyces sp. CBMA29]
MVLTRDAVEFIVDWIVGARLVEERQKPRRTQRTAWLGLRDLLRIIRAARTRSSRTTETETAMG